MAVSLLQLTLTGIFAVSSLLQLTQIPEDTSYHTFSTPSSHTHPDLTPILVVTGGPEPHHVRPAKRA
eukprot:531098-Prymnesium_polylepis.1